jgi:L,D-peptidoglycan transpeptidase YkuD (ErfK/YbiS/YcfS/YnhG family)
VSDLILGIDQMLRIDNRAMPAIIGRSGLIAADIKREGDGATPIGRWPLRRVLYRPDRLAPPVTALPVNAILPDDLWCDAPDHPLYNRPVRKPFAASAEDMWRHDHVYDLVVILGHNDDPPIPYAGSAIFLHLTRPDLKPTAGCVALALPDLQTALAQVIPGDCLVVEPLQA